MCSPCSVLCHTSAPIAGLILVRYATKRLLLLIEEWCGPSWWILPQNAQLWRVWALENHLMAQLPICFHLCYADDSTLPIRSRNGTTKNVKHAWWRFRSVQSSTAAEEWCTAWRKVGRGVREQFGEIMVLNVSAFAISSKSNFQLLLCII